ncbi:prepilin-type N-terminal cleavage/methylation domain-containing protein [Geothrix sp. 21YS21S-2]|uniref:prepilin-type N-terminal cleavage/methylation domain-containing protein n=1 Tax=Geothrix sp. 21YS21S-2 TaxID=3068893 RepID=UPI0027B90668|nr:prepilin-type N-terminal cleavage/methylation domain-containing protein [Geothrix sp. 21YS21S-2]
MTSHPTETRRRSQAGFSMVEMLMAAFILAIGILGLSMLQTMSLKAGRGSQSMANAVKIADRIMDQVEAEGRLSWLSITNTPLQIPETLSDLQYIGQGTRYQGFGEVLDASTNLVKITPVSTAPVGSKPELSSTVRYIATFTEANNVNNAGGIGQTSDYSVTVEFADDVNKTGTAVLRTVNIARRIIHG